MDDDTHRWADDNISAPETSTLFMFVPGEYGTMLSVRICLATEHNTRVIRVRLNIACMLAFLDMDYWTVPTAPLTSWNRKRVQSYLHRVREDIAKELIVTDEATLLDRSFQPNASRHWAVRVHHGLGHSNTGRTMYNEHCKVNGLIPYMEDFVNYGLHHSLPMIHADWSASLDWIALYNGRFGHVVCPNALFRCPTNVEHEERDWMCSRIFLATIAGTGTSMIPQKESIMGWNSPALRTSVVEPHLPMPSDATMCKFHAVAHIVT